LLRKAQERIFRDEDGTCYKKDSKFRQKRLWATDGKPWRILKLNRSPDALLLQQENLTEAIDVVQVKWTSTAGNAPPYHALLHDLTLEPTAHIEKYLPTKPYHIENYRVH